MGRGIKTGMPRVMWNWRMYSRMCMERTKTVTATLAIAPTLSYSTKNKHHQTNNTHIESKNQHPFNTLRPSKSIKNTTNKIIPSNTPTLSTKALHCNIPYRLSRNTGHCIIVKFFKKSQSGESLHRCKLRTLLRFNKVHKNPVSLAISDILLCSKEDLNQFLLRKGRQ